MSTALLDELLAGHVGPARSAGGEFAAAKAANAAKHEHLGRPALAPAVCEGLRIHANAGAGSQTFAGVRTVRTGPQSGPACGSSQDSQDSQGCPTQCAAGSAGDLAAVAWTDADIASFLDRRARLLRWGWPQGEAEGLAERLVRRDRERTDDRVNCADCGHYRPGRCGNHRRAGLGMPDVGRDLAALLQRCPGFNATIADKDAIARGET